MTAFDWTAVSWGGPDQPAATECAVCDAPLPEDDVPLILWSRNGWSARFCAACQQRFWGTSGTAVVYDYSDGRAALAYHDPAYPARTCESCGKSYTGPAIYCSLRCAVEDA
jgi:hypothetical protein